MPRLVHPGFATGFRIETRQVSSEALCEPIQLSGAHGLIIITGVGPMGVQVDSHPAQERHLCVDEPGLVESLDTGSEGPVYLGPVGHADH